MNLNANKNYKNDRKITKIVKETKRTQQTLFVTIGKKIAEQQIKQTQSTKSTEVVPLGVPLQ